MLAVRSEPGQHSQGPPLPHGQGGAGRTLCSWPTSPIAEKLPLETNSDSFLANLPAEIKSHPRVYLWAESTFNNYYECMEAYPNFNWFTIEVRALLGPGGKCGDHHGLWAAAPVMHREARCDAIDGPCDFIQADTHEHQKKLY